MDIMPQCFICKHFNFDKKLTCTAFREGIPQDILVNLFDHRKPHPGDGGTTFERKDENV